MAATSLIGRHDGRVDPAPIRCACIDIGSNTTRLLVVDVLDGTLREVVAQRAFTRLGRELRRSGALSPAAIRADRKSTRLNSSHANISYAVFCLKNKRALLTV